MASSGAIPKVKGGARPKTKVIANGDVRNKTKERSFNCVSNAKANEVSNFTDGKSQLTPEEQLQKRIDLSDNFVAEYSRTSFIDISVGNSKPLDIREILIADEGVQIKRSALSPDWVEKRIFIHYTRPPVCNLEGEYVVGAVDAWVEQMEFLVGDLSWLLCLPHYRFWSQVVYDKSVQECLHFYLMLGPRWYDRLPDDESCLAVINTIHQLTFLVYVRMATYKESKEDHITPLLFGDLIYNNFLYDICKILDLCVLYGSSNRPLLQRIVNNVFTYQPKYFEDLSELTLSLFSVLKNLEEKLGIADPTIPNFLNGFEAKLTLEELKDILAYMLDSLYSLQAFLSIFPKACETFHEKDFEIRLSTFYERVIPKLTEHLSPDENDSEKEVLLRRELQETLHSVRLAILFVFREILSRICLTGNDEQQDPLTWTLSRRIESLVHILTSTVEEKIFITDYSAAFDLAKDIQLFQEEGADLTTLNFTKEAVDSIVKEMASEEAEVPTETKTDQIHEHDTSGMNGYYAGKTCSLSPVEIESLASMVQDLFPDLGIGFIKECLRYYNYSSEEVLNAILEGNLPPCLDALDRTMKEPLNDATVNARIRVMSPEEDLKNSKENLVDMLEESNVLVSRLNIYDDDEFDVFKKSTTTHLKKKQIHRGKIDKEFEKDPDLKEKVKNIIHQYEWNQGYSIYDDEEKYTTMASTEYDDEYDDTYADNEAGDIDTFERDVRRLDRGVHTIWGRGSLNTRAMNFMEEEEEENEKEGNAAQWTGRGPPAEAENRRTDLTSTNKETFDRKSEKFKKANASQRRVYADRDQEWNCSSTMSFRNSNRGNSWQGHNAYGGDSNPGSADNSGEREPNTVRSTFEPFCENPEETRQRMERNRQNKQFRNKGYVQAPSNSVDDSASNSSASTSTYQRTSTKTNKHSGKTWRQGPSDGDDTDGRKLQGGKYKEDTNHGKSQDRNYRYKMTHKNEQRRNAAQAKYRSNF